MKLWQGALKGAKDAVIAFNSSENIVLDEELILYDILGSIAHVKMLAKQGIIKKEESEEIVNALKIVYKKYENGEFVLDPALEDVHTNVENAVTKLTIHGKKMHTARSRNDQVLLDMRLYLRDQILAIANAIVQLQKSFSTLAMSDGIYVGYTHTRVAQPITVSFWCDAYIQGLNRDLDRLFDCYKRVTVNPLGAGAIAGTNWNIDREYTAKLLGFDTVEKNELDAISSRGELEAELLSYLSILMTKLSGISEELIWVSQKGLIEIPEEFCTGSSMMPNKKNPDVLELIRARSAKVYGLLIEVLTIRKGLISGYHSDMQETKTAIMEGIEVTKACVLMMAELVKELKFNQKLIERELNEGFAQATEIADSLVKKGIPFREAHGIVGKLVSECKKQNIPLSKAKLLTQFSEEEWKEAVSLERKRLQKKIVVDSSYEQKISTERMKIQEITKLVK